MQSNLSFLPMIGFLFFIFTPMDDRYFPAGQSDGLHNFTVSEPKESVPYGMSKTAYKAMRRMNGKIKSTLFTKKWTRWRRNQLNVENFMMVRIQNKRKYA